MRRAMKRARIKAGFTLKELSEKSLVSISTISNWERGICAPNIEAAILVSDALGITLNEYIGYGSKTKRN